MCLQTSLTENDICYPFRCCHFLCDGCNAALVRRGDDRCPQCRAFRFELEPDSEDGVQGFVELAQLLQHFRDHNVGPDPVVLMHLPPASLPPPTQIPPTMSDVVTQAIHSFNHLDEVSVSQFASTLEAWRSA